MPSPSKQIDPRDLFITRNPTGLTSDDLEKGRSGFVDYRTHGDYMVFLAGYEAAAGLDPSEEGQSRHALIEAEGCKPEISIRPVTSAATGTVAHDLNQAEGEQPDLNFHLLLLAERSCSLLEDWVKLTNAADETVTEHIKATRSLLESQSSTWSAGVYDVLTERRRQIYVEGWTTAHDDSEAHGELAAAAATYALRATGVTVFDPDTWPWEPEWLKPSDPRRMLIKAAALILAEIERLDRQAAGGAQP